MFTSCKLRRLFEKHISKAIIKLLDSELEERENLLEQKSLWSMHKVKKTRMIQCDFWSNIQEFFSYAEWEEGVQKSLMVRKYCLLRGEKKQKTEKKKKTKK